MALWALDGTWCTRKDISNVHAFALRYRGPKSYWAGPGTAPQSAGFGLSGAMAGTGAARIVEGVVAQIRKAWEADNELKIDLVGFSRGAAIANEVATVLNGERWGKDDKKAAPKVRFLGLFDPVHSMGMLFYNQAGDPLFLGNRFWNGKTIPTNVENSAIAYADDERSPLFRPSDLVGPNRDKHKREKFDGVHGDVGGSLGSNQHLGKISLRWIVERAVAAGLEMNTAGIVTDAWIEQAKDRGWLEPGGKGQATGPRPWAVTF